MDNQQDSMLGKIKKRLTRKVVIISSIVIGLGLILYLGLSIKIQIPSNPLDILKMKATVTLKKEYKNPFSKDTQYVNPFQAYKNPFVVGK